MSLNLKLSTHWLGAAGLIVGVATLAMLAVLLPVSAEVPTQTVQSPEGTFSGTTEVTTAADRSWTAVTVAEQPGKPLSAAFVVQYQNPLPSSLDYHGLGSVTLDEAGLAVNSSDEGWLFKFPSYTGPLPAGRTAMDVIGIVRYRWSAANGRPRPLSHREFIQSVNKPPNCDYGQCSCSGGSGAQSCTCQHCSVSCYAPYEACCAANCWCCQPGGLETR